MCINLTNSSAEICESLNTDTSLSNILTRVITENPERYFDEDYRSDRTSHLESSSISEEQEIKESRFEVLLLCLGLMINFVQESDKVKDIILASPLAGSIKTVFENLISRDVSSCSKVFLLTRRNLQIMPSVILHYYWRISSSLPRLAKQSL